MTKAYISLAFELDEYEKNEASVLSSDQLQSQNGLSHMVKPAFQQQTDACAGAGSILLCAKYDLESMTSMSNIDDIQAYA